MAFQVVTAKPIPVSLTTARKPRSLLSGRFGNWPPPLLKGYLVAFSPTDNELDRSIRFNSYGFH